MLGKRVSATLWAVQYRFLNDEPPRRIHLPNEQPKEPDKFKGGEVQVLTADPTGKDLCEVAEIAVRGKISNCEFTMTHVHRIGDICGLARVEERKD